MDEREREQLKAEIRQELLAEIRATKHAPAYQFGQRVKQMVQKELGTNAHDTYVIVNGLYAIIRNAFCVGTVANLNSYEQQEEALKMAVAIVEIMKIKRERYIQ